jgi:hypothetical protein
MNNFEVCKGICDLHGTIAGAGIIEKARLVAMYNRPGTPIPTEEEFGRFFLQTEIIASITKSNVAFFGQARHFTISFENSDMYFFLLSRYARPGVLAIQLVQPYDHEEIINKVDQFLGRSL